MAGFLTGTILNLIILGALSASNGTPFPWGHYDQMIAYPTGSEPLTFLLVWAVYLASLLLFRKRREKNGSRRLLR